MRIAHQILTQNLSESHFEQGELEISDPELSYRSAAEPLLLEAGSLSMEIAAAIKLLDTNDEIARRRGVSHSGCIAVVGYSGFEVQQYGSEIGIPVLDGASKFLQGSRFLSDLEQTKGYEFDTMVIVNCAQGHLPPSGAPEQEVFRNASEFYVAMTRAKNQLILSFSGAVCKWLSTLQLPVSLWSDVVDMDDLSDLGIPGYLQEFPDTEKLDLSALTGTEFVFTPYARGLEVDLQERLEDLVDGRGMLQAGTQRRLKWRNIGSLYDDLQSGVGGAIWGPVARSVLQHRLTEAALGLRPSLRSRPARKKSSISPQIKASIEQVEKAFSDQDDALSDGLEGLELTTRQKMILHSMHIKTPQEFLLASEASLSKYLTKTVISELKDRARETESLRSVKNSAEIDLSEVNLSKHIVAVLRRMDIKKISDFKRFSKNDLWSQTQLRSADVQAILVFCRGHGIELKDL